MRLELDLDTLRPLIREIIAEVIAEMGTHRLDNPDEILTEAEAASRLRLNPWQLRDERLRGRIQASAVVGRRIRYTAADLQRYLSKRTVNAAK